RRRHTRCLSDWSSDVCSSDLSGRKDEGAKELAISKELRDRAMRPQETQNQKFPELANLSEKEEITATETILVSPETRKQADDYRSEERRVGKECRVQRSRSQC